jgi:predicted HTH transcriptional regulator
MSTLPDPAVLAADALPIRTFSADLLDHERIAAHIAHAEAHGRYEGSHDVMDYLYDHQCLVTVAETTYLTLTAILCFGTKPQAILPHAVIDVAHYQGLNDSLDDLLHVQRGQGGTIIDQLNWVTAYLSQTIARHQTVDPESMKPVAVHEYPLPIIRELSAMMLAHRDYHFFGVRSRIQILRNRLEWIYPGTPLDPSDDATEPAWRNPNIMRILVEHGLISATSQGLESAQVILREESMRPATLVHDGNNEFRATVFSRYAAPTEHRSEQTMIKIRNLNTSQQLLYGFIKANKRVTPREIRTFFPDRNERTIQRNLNVLLNAKLIMVHGESRSRFYTVAE